MLASPAYGERWAQHWLDLARFAETDGFEHDKSRLNAWKYRDWVIQALNRDLPYDRFVLAQLAGDELAPDDEVAAIPTAFCLSGPDMPDINSQDERRHVLLNELTSTVSAVFLGLQMGCAQCHDHKYDALSMADFYGLRAIFAPSVQPQANRSMGFLRLADSAQTRNAIMLRGDWRRAGPEVAPRTPQVLTGTTPLEADGGFHDLSSLRTELARWILRQPLATRVVVNRIWQHHFGQGLSATPSDFGVMGEEPSHPLLLDWLAARLQNDAWSLKRLHRLIMTSAVYRQDSPRVHHALSEPREVRRAGEKHGDSAAEGAAETPSAARWLACYPRRRLDAEAVRDRMLLVGGLMDWRRGGPGVRPPLPPELVATLLKDHWPVSARRADHYRRSIYIFVRRNLKMPLLESFDRPDANATCARRHESIVPTQALNMMNSPLAWEVASRVADDQRNVYGDTQRIERVFLRVLGRRPNPREVALAHAHLRESQRAPENALAELCLALLNSNEFVFVD